MARTARQLIIDALGKCQALQVGDVPTAEEINDGLRMLNDLLANWSIEQLSVWERATEFFNTTGGQATYTIGAGGNWNTTRPVRIDSQGVCRFQGVDYPMLGVGMDQYNLHTLKTQPGDVIEQFLYVNDYPLGTVTLWPVPVSSTVGHIGLHIDRQLTQVTNLTATLAFPPGYEPALVYNLALLLASDYGTAPPPEVVSLARNFKADIKRANKRKTPPARFDDMPGVHGGDAMGSQAWRTGV
jgi:hypothetical protein